MSKQKACKSCKAIFEENACPVCKETETTDTIKGRVYIFDTEKSEIADNLNIKQKGEYAIKIK